MNHPVEGVKILNSRDNKMPFLSLQQLYRVGDQNTYDKDTRISSGKIVLLTDIGAGNVPARVEIDPDELSLKET